MARFVLCGLLLLVTRPTFGAGAPVWKWKEGDTFYVRTVSRIKQNFAIEDARGLKGKPGIADVGREVSQEYEHTTLLSYTVRKVNKDGSAELVQKLEETTIRSGDALLKKDAGPSDTPPRKDTSLKDTPLVLHVTPAGIVTKVEGQKELLKKLAGNDSGKEAVLAAALSEEALKKQTTQSLGFLPPQPLKKGMHWKKPAGLPLGPLGDLDAERTYAYDGSPSDKGPLKITFTTAVKSFTPGKVPSRTVQVIGGKLKATEGKGSLEFDAAAGRLVKASSSLKLQGELTFKNGDTEYRGQLDAGTVVRDKGHGQTPRLAGTLLARAESRETLRRSPDPG